MGERKAELPGRLPALISWGKRRWKLAAGACGVLLIALLVVLAYADIKYQAVRPAPRLRNAEWAGYTPDIRLVLQPALAAPVLPRSQARRDAGRLAFPTKRTVRGLPDRTPGCGEGHAGGGTIPEPEALHSSVARATQPGQDSRLRPVRSNWSHPFSLFRQAFSF